MNHELKVPKTHSLRLRQIGTDLAAHCEFLSTLLENCGGVPEVRDLVLPMVIALRQCQAPCDTLARNLQRLTAIEKQEHDRRFAEKTDAR